jgi:capsular polysaccharide biosynthesis protein
MTQLITTQNDRLPATPSAEPPENPHTPVRRLAEAAFRSKGLLILLAMLGGTIGATLGILKPNEYVSTATFIFRDGSEQMPIKPMGDLPRDWGRSIGVTENAPHLLVAPTVARNTVERLGVAKVFQPFKPKNEGSSWLTDQIRVLQASVHNRDPSKYSVDDGMAQLLGHLKISNFSRARLLNVSYTANDPRLAQEILEAYVDEATKFHIEAYTQTETVRIVKADQENAVAEFDAAKLVHDALLRKSGLTNFELEFGALQLESSQSARDFRKLEEQEVPSLQILIKETQKTIAGMSPRIDKRSEVLVPNQLITQLGERILQAKDDLMTAKIRFKRDDAVEVMRVKRRLSTLEESLKTERKRPPKLVSRTESVVNEEYSMLKAQLQASKIKLLVAEQNVVPYRKRANAQKARFDAIAAIASEYRTSASDLERARDSLRRANAQLSQAHTKQRLKENQLSTLKLVGKPTFKPSRTGPRRGQMALIGLLAGLFLGLGFTAMRALTDTTIRTPEELEKMLGLRVLATVPDMRGKHVRRHENRILSGC